jgi:hypothetical protein
VVPRLGLELSVAEVGDRACAAETDADKTVRSNARAETPARELIGATGSKLLSESCFVHHLFVRRRIPETKNAPLNNDRSLESMRLPKDGCFSPTLLGAIDSGAPARTLIHNSRTAVGLKNPAY